LLLLLFFTGVYWESSEGAALWRTPEMSIVCPYNQCGGGAHGKPVTIRLSDFSRFRAHVSTHVAQGYVPSPEWLAENQCRLCPNCSLAITSLTQLCVSCKKIAVDPVAPPRAQRIPKIKKNVVIQLDMGGTADALSRGLPEIKVGGPSESPQQIITVNPLPSLPLLGPSPENSGFGNSSSSSDCCSLSNIDTGNFSSYGFGNNSSSSSSCDPFFLSNVVTAQFAGLESPPGVQRRGGVSSRSGELCSVSLPPVTNNLETKLESKVEKEEKEEIGGPPNKSLIISLESKEVKEEKKEIGGPRKRRPTTCLERRVAGPLPSQVSPRSSPR
jgi:hypothetical protein